MLAGASSATCHCAPPRDQAHSVEVMGLCSNLSWPADLGKCGVNV